MSCDTKVSDDGAPVVFDKDVFGFQVAVDDFDAVGGVESFADLDGEIVGFGEGERTALFEDMIEGFAVDQFHREIIVTALFAEVKDARDVAVCDLSGESDFAFEACEDLGVMELSGEQKFEGDDIVEFEVAGAVDFPRSPFADQGDEFVTICDALGFEGGGPLLGIRGECWRAWWRRHRLRRLRLGRNLRKNRSLACCERSHPRERRWFWRSCGRWWSLRRLVREGGCGRDVDLWG